MSRGIQHTGVWEAAHPALRQLLLPVCRGCTVGVPLRGWRGAKDSARHQRTGRCLQGVGLVGFFGGSAGRRSVGGWVGMLWPRLLAAACSGTRRGRPGVRRARRRGERGLHPSRGRLRWFLWGRWGGLPLPRDPPPLPRRPSGSCGLPSLRRYLTHHVERALHGRESHHPLDAADGGVLLHRAVPG